ncbi:MAG: hypothetical protein L3J39_10225 [Verrucomicrobiales bacterium]|nr:hypothetical protein [Verrucomicrobiales bacterium]
MILILGTLQPVFAQTDKAKQDLEEFAQLPYGELVKIAHNDSSQSKQGDKDRLRFVLASNQGVPLSQITLTLQLETGPLSLSIDEQGHFTVPYSQALLKEDPMMISNQSRGSLSLKFTVAVPKLGEIEAPEVREGKVLYQALFSSLLRFKKAMEKVDSKFGENGDQQLAVQCMTEGAALTIHQAFGSRKIQAGKDQSVWLRYDKRLYQENPSISVPEGTKFYLRPVSPERIKELKKKK